MAMPRVSVNLCCYNAESFLEETLQSIFAQTDPDWELVIVNDASTDGTDALIRSHIAAGRPIVYDPLSSNVGLGAARNRALARSSGELIAFIDHDDVWHPKKLACQVPLFDADPRVGLVYSDCVNVWEHGEWFRQFDRLRPCEGEAFPALLAQYPVSIQTVVIRRRALEDGLVGFDPRFRVLEDMEFVLRLSRRWRLAVVRDPLAWIKMRRDSATWTLRDRWPVEMRLILEALRADPEIERRHPEALARFVFEIARMEARIAWERGRRADALACLEPYRRRYREALRDVWLVRCLPHAAYQRVRRWMVRGAQALRLTEPVKCPTVH